MESKQSTRINQNDDDDDAILNILPNDNNNNDQCSLFNDNSEQNNSGSLTSYVHTIQVPSISRYRLTNILPIVSLIEFLTLLIIWLVGGSDHYLIDDLIHYHFKTSIFDIVSISLFKLVCLTILLTELETNVIDRLYQPNTRPLLIFLRYLYKFLLILLSIGSLTFSIIKFIFILHDLKLSKLYLSSIYLFLIFSSIEFIGILLTIPYLSRIKLLEQQRSTENKRKVDLKRLISLAKSVRLLISMGTIFLLISSATQIIQPYYFGKIVDDALTSDSMHLVTKGVVILFGINCVGAIASLFRAWIFELAGQKVVYGLRQNIFNAIMKQDIEFFDENRTGELTNRLSSDTQVLQDAVTINVSMLFRFLIQIIGSLVVMFYLEATLTLVLMTVVPIIILVSRQYGSVVRKLRKKFQDELAEAGTTAEESISNIRENLK